MGTQLLLSPADQALFLEALEKLGTPNALALVMTVQEMTRETDVTMAYRKAAQLGCDDDLEIDDTAVVSVVEDGAWVSAAFGFRPKRFKRTSRS